MYGHEALGMHESSNAVWGSVAVTQFNEYATTSQGGSADLSAFLVSNPTWLAEMPRANTLVIYN